MKTIQNFIIAIGLVGFIAAANRSFAGDPTHSPDAIEMTPAANGSMTRQAKSPRAAHALCLLQQCQTIELLGSPCGAVTGGTNGSTARARAFSHADAERFAIDTCASNWGDCELVCSRCIGADEQ